MDPQIEAELLAASQELKLPGTGDRRILTPVAVERLSESWEWPRWQIEALALDLGVAPLHYLRNLSQFGHDGQVRLLRSSVAVVGASPVLDRALELLAVNGIGRFAILVPISSDDEEADARATAERLAAVTANRNASSVIDVRTFRLRGGNPAEALRGADAVCCCLEDSSGEQLLQFACRMLKLPLVVSGIQERAGQATTVYPGDPGVALVYKPTHPHLEPDRAGMGAERQACLMVAAWVADQVTRVLLGEGDILQGRLLYGDLENGDLAEYTLG